VTLPPDSAEPDPLLDEALEWVVRLRTGEPTRADVDALQEWRGRSAAHEAAFRRAAEIYQRGGIAAAELAAEQKARAIADAGSLRRRRLARRALLGGAAAAAAGYMVVQPPLGLWSSLQELSADYRTRKGEQRRIDVVSGVSMDLDTQTSIALRSQQNEARIELISGQAAITAARPASDPLVLLAADGRITAAQAQFDARCFGDVVSVTCLNGAVDVERGGRSVHLQASQQVSYSAAGIGNSMAADPAQVTAWQSGLLVFRDQPLSNVVDEVNRYRPGKIIIVSAALKPRLVNGTFQIQKLDNFVAQVQQLFGASATTLPGGIVLLS
jgi:transmembrane sensor